MSFFSRMLAHGRASAAAALIGSGLGLGLGAVYMASGLGEAAAEQARAAPPEDLYVDLALPEAADAPVRTAQAAGLKPAIGAPVRAAPPQARGKDLDCLTAAVYYEARGESPSGQAAVAQVVLNRVRHPAFPKTVCGVVYQGVKGRGCQFSFACNGAQHADREPAAWKRARKVAISAMAGAQISQVGTATHFHTTGVSPKWGPQMIRVGQVGLHVFYRIVPGRKPLRAEPERAVFASFAPPRHEGSDATPAPEIRLSMAMLDAQGEPQAARQQPDAAAAAEAPAAEPVAAHPAAEPTVSAPTPVS